MSSRVGAALGSALFLVVVPGTVAGLVPWLISGWEVDPAWPLALRAAGLVLAAMGVAVLVTSFVQFVLEGRGTPAPVAPPEILVVRGVYRHVRNPMYLAVGAVIAGQAMALPSLGVLIWGAAFSVGVISFVAGYEQPTLRRRFGDQYDAYCRAVHAWWPRRRPWSGG